MVDIMPNSIMTYSSAGIKQYCLKHAMFWALRGSIVLCLSQITLSGSFSTLLFTSQILTDVSHPGLSSSVQITYALVSAKNRIYPSIILKNGFSGDIYPLLKEPSNFHAVVDGPQLSLEKSKAWNKPNPINCIIIWTIEFLHKFWKLEGRIRFIILFNIQTGAHRRDVNTGSFKSPFIALESFPSKTPPLPWPKSGASSSLWSKTCGFGWTFKSALELKTSTKRLTIAKMHWHICMQG